MGNEEVKQEQTTDKKDQKKEGTVKTPDTGEKTNTKNKDKDKENKEKDS